MSNQTIFIRNPEGPPDQRIVLRDGQCARLMFNGNSWSQLRIGVRHSFNASNHITGTPRLAFGVCSGTTNLFGDASCDHFVGAVSNGATWSYAASPGPSFTGHDIRVAKKVATTLSVNGAAFIVGWLSAAVDEWAMVSMVEITKGSPNFTVSGVGIANVAGAGLHISRSLFEKAMAASTLGQAAILLGPYGQTANQTIAVDEGSDGDLDAIALMWNRTAYPYENSDVAYRIIS